MMTVAEQNALRIENEKLQEKLKLMQQIGTREGFFQYYFKEIKNYSSREKAFNFVNGLYFDLYKEYRYSDYNCFRNTISKINKSNKK